MDELKACPFCGAQAELYCQKSRNWVVKCTGCRAASDDFGIDANIAAWNRRPSPWLPLPADPVPGVGPWDGKPVDLLLASDPRERTTDMKWDANSGRFEDCRGYQFWVEVDEATHWMPSPPPPAPEDGR